LRFFLLREQKGAVTVAEPNLNDVLTGMVGALQPFLPAQIPGLPLPSPFAGAR